jgi:hypothetical protein
LFHEEEKEEEVVGVVVGMEYLLSLAHVGNHMRKELVPYCVNYKEYVL